MFDIGFWEILIIAVVLLLVMGPERLPEVAKQAAFFVRKARQGMFRLRNEMRSEMGTDPFEGLNEARREVSNLKNDMKQFGRDLAESHEEKPNADAVSESEALSESVDALGDDSTSMTEKVSSETKASSETKVSSDNKASSSKKASKKVSKKVSKKKTTKKVTKKKTTKKKAAKKVTKKIL